MMDSGDNRLEGNTIFDWAVVLAPLAGDTLYSDFKIG